MNLLHWLYSWKIKLMTDFSDSLRKLQKSVIYIWKQKFGNARQLLTAVMIGKLTTALREWFAMNQQQVAIAQRTPDRNPETHRQHTFASHTPLQKSPPSRWGGTTKVKMSHTPINTASQHGFLSQVYDHFGNQIISLFVTALDIRITFYLIVIKSGTQSNRCSADWVVEQDPGKVLGLNIFWKHHVL